MIYNLILGVMDLNNALAHTCNAGENILDDPTHDGAHISVTKS
jgi:hypothetical protein